MRVQPVVARLGLILLWSVTATGCPTVDLGETPVAPGACRPDPAYFRDVIWPEFIAPPDTSASCIAASGCHDGSNNGLSSLRFVTQQPIDFQTNYDIMTGFLNCASPEASRALTKPLMVLPHGGGQIFTAGSTAESTFLMWFDL